MIFKSRRKNLWAEGNRYWAYSSVGAKDGKHEKVEKGIGEVTGGYSEKRSSLGMMAFT